MVLGIACSYNYPVAYAAGNQGAPTRNWSLMSSGHMAVGSTCHTPTSPAPAWLSHFTASPSPDFRCLCAKPEPFLKEKVRLKEFSQPVLIAAKNIYYQFFSGSSNVPL